MPALVYEPKGKVADLLDAMRNSPLDVWDATMVGEAMDVPRKNVAAYIHAVTKNGLLHVKLENGRSHFSLKPFPVPGEPAAAPAKWSATAPVVVLPPPPGPRAKAPAALAPIVARAPAPTPTPAPLDVPTFLANGGPAMPETEEEEGDEDEPEPIRWTHWDDGDLQLWGLEQGEDGSVTIPAEVLLRIKARIAWSPLS